MKVSQTISIMLSEDEIECLQKANEVLKEMQEQLQKGNYTSDIEGMVFHASDISKIRKLLDTLANDYLFFEKDNSIM